MFPVCYICLRGDRKLRSLPKELKRIYEELCDFENDIEGKFCFECIYKLKKFNDFKKICLLGVNKLKSYKKRTLVKKSIQQLYSEMPPAQLSLCKINNFKVYFYNSDGNSAPIMVSGSTYPHIVTMSISNDDIYSFDSKPALLSSSVFVEPIKEEKLSEVYDNGPGTLPKCDEQAEDSTTQVKIEIQNDSDDDDDISDDNTDLSERHESDSDDSVKELKAFASKLNQDKDMLEKVKVFTKSAAIIEDEPVNKFRKRNIDRNVLISNLKKKFNKYGPVKDHKGTIIEVEVVIGSLDSFSLKSLCTLYNICSRPGPFQPTHISFLSRIQARFPYATIFRIKYLHDDKALMKAEFEKRRNYPEYVESNHRCESCLKAFKCAKMLDYHNRIQHDESMPSQCWLCHARLRNDRSMYKHTLACHGMLYECKLCDYVTNKRELMTKHYERHQGSTGFNCKYCNEKFMFPAQMYIHINKMHGAKNICELCACAFHNPKGLYQHKIKKHEQTGEEFVQSEHNTKCEECDILFVTDVVYRKHLKISHNVTESGPRKFACHVCDWVGISPVSRKEHYLSDHTVEDYNTLRVMKTNLTKSRLCEWCGKKFMNISMYKTHLNTHTGVRPYACDMCSKTFFSKQGLKLHKDRHLPPTWVCNICGKKYNDQTNLHRHKKSHMEQTEIHPCSMCDKAFARNYLLKNHIKGVHYDGYKKRNDLKLLE